MIAKMPTRTWNLDDIQAFARVACSGETHTIILDKRGRLHFCDHPKGYCSTVFQMRKEAGLPAEGCQQVLENWRSERRWNMPHDLQAPVEVNNKRKQERSLKRGQNVDPWATRTPENYRKSLLALATRTAANVAKKATAYRKAPTARRHLEAHKVEILIAQPHEQLCATSTTDKKAIGGRSRTASQFTFSVRPNWITKVKKRGVGLVEGHFILDVLEEKPSGRLRVLAVRQGPGLDLFVDEAIMSRSGEKWTLAWGRPRQRNTVRMPATNEAQQ